MLSIYILNNSLIIYLTQMITIFIWLNKCKKFFVRFIQLGLKPMLLID